MATLYTSFTKRGVWPLVRLISLRPTPRLCYLKPRASADQGKRWFADRCSAHNRYRYRGLDQARDIRILELRPAEAFNDPLHLSLKQVSLEDHDRLQFEAVSYVWGARRGEQVVLCDDETIRVTSNCESLLRHLRLKDRARHLWVDALCINQSSTSDKNHQVPLMGDIFESAERVIIWLGPERSSVANFFRRVKLFNPFISPQLYVMRRFGPWAGHEFRRLNFVSRIANWAWVHSEFPQSPRTVHVFPPGQRANLLTGSSCAQRGGRTNPGGDWRVELVHPRLDAPGTTSIFEVRDCYRAPRVSLGGFREYLGLEHEVNQVSWRGRVARHAPTAHLDCLSKYDAVACKRGRPQDAERPV